MKKRLLPMLLAAALVCALLPTATLAADSDFRIENGVLTAYFGSGGHVVIPSGVTAIGNFAFDGHDKVTSVTIPSGVTSIGDWAFSRCTSLTSITIPDSVTSIGLDAFDGTPWLKNLGEFAVSNGILLAYQGQNTNVTIPDSVTSIGVSAFSGYTDLTSVIIPNGVTSIGDNAFNQCSNLTSVTIPDGVTSIGDNAFNKCSSLTSVIIPDSVTSIGEYAFSRCSNLTNVTIPAGVTSIREGTFKGCSSLTSVIIPDGVTSIGDYAFYACSSLTSVTIPDSVTQIEYTAFFNFPGLTIYAPNNSCANTYANEYEIHFVGINAIPTPVPIPGITPFQYNSAGEFSDGLADVWRGGKGGFIDKTGKEVVPCKYDFVYPFRDGFAIVGVGKDPNLKYGLIDTTGKEIVPPNKYDSIWYFEDGFAQVSVGKEEDQKCGLIDTTGKEVFPPNKYSSMSTFSEGLALVELNGKWGFIDKTGKEVIPCKYAEADGFSGGIARVSLPADKADWNSGIRVGDYLWGFIDKTGKEVVPCQYVRAGDFQDGLAAVTRYKSLTHWGFVDKTGKEVIPRQYHSVQSFSCGLAAVEQAVINEKTGYEEWKWGFIDTTGKLVIPCKYDKVEPFVDGVAAVRIDPYPDGQWGLIDTTGKEVTPCIYNDTIFFFDGYALVPRLHAGWGLLDTTGKEVVPCQYGMVTYSISDGMAAVLDKESRKWGYLDVATGNLAVPYMYDSARDCVDDIAPVEVDGKWGFISVSAGATNGAHPNIQTVDVDGKKVEFQCYALKDKNGNDTNYIKLRDLAYILNGSAAQFQVGWDGNVTISTKTAYTTNGTELITPFIGQHGYEKTAGKTLVDGVEISLDTFQLKDAKGGGHTYYQLRDLGKALGFNVGWSGERGIFIETNKPYGSGN